MEKIKVFYLDICPVDKNGAYAEEIYNYGLCQKDFKRLKDSLFNIIKKTINENFRVDPRNIIRVNPRSLLNFEEDYLVLKKLKEFQNFFEQNTGHKPLRLQIYWAKRVFKKESFSIIAPTGIGKTTFGNIISHFLDGKVYYLVPSKILLREIEKKLKSINSNKKILVIKEKKDKELLESGDFDILLTTANFLHKNFDIIPKNFDLVFIDDADSLIRQPKNIDKVLKLIKFTDEEIEKALDIVDKRRTMNHKGFMAVNPTWFTDKGQVIAASATLTPRTKRIALFRELLGFEIGSATTYLRNVEEVYEEINHKPIRNAHELMRTTYEPMRTDLDHEPIRTDDNVRMSSRESSQQFALNENNVRDSSRESSQEFASNKDNVSNSSRDSLQEFAIKQQLFEKSVEWIKKLGQGGFVFLSDDFKKEDLNSYLKFLKQNDISAVSYEKFNAKNQKNFLEGKIDVVLGFSNIRNPLTRGIDLPQKVRYALFLGVPKFKVPLKLSYSPLHLFLLGLTIREIIDDKNFIDRRLNFLKKISFLKEENVLVDENLKNKIEPIKREFEEILKDKEVIEKLKDHPKIVLELNKENNEFYGSLIVSDPRGYLQASGRTSRLFPFGLTKGLAVILVENIKTLKHLQDKLKILGYESNFKKVDEVNLDEILKQINKDREIVQEVLEGKEYIFQDPIETVLVIVESPTKAKTIANFFGKPARRYKGGAIFYEISLGNLHLNICATLGHFVDLTHQDGYYGVRKENNEFVPVFQPLKICQNCQRHLELNEDECSLCHSKNILSKQDLIKNLQKIALEVDKIYLATDPDTEGEKIAFDLFNYLYPYNQNIKRIELHEITRTEFIKKIKEPREIDLNLVKAQLLRRISDRWIGFKLSEEIQDYFQNLNLSAGRVQTPVLGWILEKEKRIKQKHYLVNLGFNNQNFYFYSENENLIKELKEKFKNQELEIEIEFIKTQKETINPLPPYETSNLLKDASSFFRLDAPTTMKIAQDLFEQGLITYHRTDSVFISDFGKNVALEYLERKNLIDLKYLRSWGKPGTHEGIRPTRPLDVQDLIENIIFEQKNLTKKHLQLYGLIFNRFIASQIKPSTALKAEIKITLPNLENKFESKDNVFAQIIKENHLKFFRNIRISEFKKGKFKIESLKIKKVSKEYHFSQGEIIDEMKRKGLGRPSTYSTIIQTLIERKYVLNRSGYLIAISWGQKIYDYLIKRHKKLVSEDFTIKLEHNMDLVAQGQVDYQKILKETFKETFEK